MAAWWDVPSLIANDDLPPLPPRLALLAGLAGPMPLAEYEAAHGSWSWPDPPELTEIAELARDGWHLPGPYVWLSDGDRLIPPTADGDEWDTDPPRTSSAS